MARLHGDTDAPLEVRLARRIEVDPQTGCHEWQGAIVGTYGSIHVEGGKAKTHRVAWELAHGPIPQGMWVLHRCDNRICCNPDHLFLGDRAANMADMVAKGRQARGERNGMAMLTNEQVVEIKALLASGALSRWTIAHRFGVSMGAISDIATGRRWRHVETPASAVTLTRASDLISQSIRHEGAVAS